MDNMTLIAIIVVAIVLFVLFARNGFQCNEGYHQHSPFQGRVGRGGSPLDDTSRAIAKVWLDHLLYTRLVMMAFFDNDPKLSSLQSRLLRNQQDIGNLLGSLYGDQVRQDITNELTKHIQIAVEVLQAVKSGSSSDQQNAISRFYNNARDIGCYLDNLFNSGDRFKHHMKMHIDTLVAHVQAFVWGDANADIDTLDRYTHAGVDMAFDMM